MLPVTGLAEQPELPGSGEAGGVLPEPPQCQPYPGQPPSFPVKLNSLCPLGDGSWTRMPVWLILCRPSPLLADSISLVGG